MVKEGGVLDELSLISPLFINLSLFMSWRPYQILHVVTMVEKEVI